MTVWLSSKARTHSFGPSALVLELLGCYILAWLLACGATSQSSAAENDFQLRWMADPARTNQMLVELAGVNDTALQAMRSDIWNAEKWQKLFTVYAEQGDLTIDSSLPPMLGSYQIAGRTIQFKPRFALEPGISYRAVFRPDRLPLDQSIPRKAVISVFELAKPPSEPTTVVTQVYPTADALPENLLKFYIYFSAPMSRGHIYEYLHLRDEAGKAIELPFLEIDEEFWDRSMMRLTLFIDPGRIKRGVKPLEEIGPALEAGKRYSLQIDREWKDASGNPLKAQFEKWFKVMQPEREPVDANKWKIQAAKAGSSQPLEVSFSRPLDHALAQRMIQIRDRADNAVPGTSKLASYETQWQFTPEQKWRAGAYNLVVQNTIEDLAGNNIGKAFEVDLFEGVQRRFTNSVIKVPFEIR